MHKARAKDHKRKSKLVNSQGDPGKSKKINSGSKEDSSDLDQKGSYLSQNDPIFSKFQNHKIFSC